jgi:hypothetical protein
MGAPRASVSRLGRAIVESLSDDLRRPCYRGDPDRLRGHCYVASEAAWHLLGGPRSGWKPMRMRHEGDTHWFLRHTATGKVLDLTAGQFRKLPDYEAATGGGFLTKRPSKRAQDLMRRVRGVLASKAPARVARSAAKQRPNPAITVRYGFDRASGVELMTLEDQWTDLIASTYFGSSEDMEQLLTHDFPHPELAKRAGETGGRVAYITRFHQPPEARARYPFSAAQAMRHLLRELASRDVQRVLTYLEPDEDTDFSTTERFLWAAGFHRIDGASRRMMELDIVTALAPKGREGRRGQPPRPNPPAAWKEPWELTFEEFSRYRVPSPCGDRSRSPADVEKLRAEGGMLSDYRDGWTLRNFLGGDFSDDLGWNSAHLASAVLAGERLPIFRATDAERTIFPGAYVTLSRGYARDHGRNILRGRFRVLVGQAYPDELVAMNPQEFFFVPRDLAAWHREEVGRAIRRRLPVPEAVRREVSASHSR